MSAPTITSISPAVGPTAGGTLVEITGTNLTGTIAVQFGGVDAASFSQNGSTQILATTPAGTAGAANVSITTEAFTAGADTPFVYLAAPTVASVNPPVSPATGGVPVTITGANLSLATGVTVGGVPAGFQVLNATSILIYTPPGTAGTASVLVTTPGGTNAGNTLLTYQGKSIPAGHGAAPTPPNQRLYDDQTVQALGDGEDEFGEGGPHTPSSWLWMAPNPRERVPYLD